MHTCLSGSCNTCIVSRPAAIDRGPQWAILRDMRVAKSYRLTIRGVPWIQNRHSRARFAQLDTLINHLPNKSHFSSFRYQFIRSRRSCLSHQLLRPLHTGPWRVDLLSTSVVML